MADTPEAIRILHVDDDTAFADVTVAFLERESDQFVVETAASASDGLEALTDGEFDCLVSDYEMPETNGIEFLDAVRSKYPELPFILFTGKGSEAVASEAISTGATDYIQKQGDASQYTVLTNRIENAVAQYRARRRSERANRRRRQTLEQITDGFIELDTAFTVLDANEQAAEFVGLSREEVVGTQYRDLITEEGDTTFLEPYSEVLEDGQPRTIEGRSDINPDRWIEERIFPTEDQDGIFVYVRDITARKERERLIREKSRQMEAMLDSVESTLWMRDADHRYLLLNQNYRELLRIDSDVTAVGKTPDAFVDDELAERFRQTDERVLSTGEQVETEEHIETRDGERVFLTRITPVCNDEGEPYATVGTATDITERKERERALEEQRQLYETLFDQSPNGIMIVQDEQIKFANSRLGAQTGWSESELLGRPFYEVIAPEYRDLVKQRYEQRIRGDQPPQNYEIAIRTADGNERVIDLYVSRIQYRERPATLATFNDITAVKEREAQLEALRNEYKTVFENIEQSLFLLAVDGEKTVRFQQINGSNQERFGAVPSAVEGQTPVDVLGKKSGRTLKKKSLKCLERGATVTYEEAATVGTEETVWETKLTPITAERERVVGASRNVTEQRQREELHDVILELSSDLISGDENEIDERIQHGLKRIGEFERADRSYVFQIRADGTRMDNTHEWCATDIDSQKSELQNLRTEQFSWFMSKVNNQETVTVPDVSELPSEASVLRQSLESGTVASMVSIPLVRGGEVLGFLGLDWTETRASWSDEMLGLLEASATIIANAFTRKETVAERKEREQTLSALHNAATEIGQAETEATVYETLIETAEQLFEFDLVAIDVEHEGYLIQEAWTVEDGDYYEKMSLEDSDTFAVQAYNRQETILVDDLREFDVVPADSRYRSALTIPIGTFGTFQTVSNTVGAFDEYDREFTELLVDHARVKLTQLQGKQRLRERTADLERKNERLDTFAGLVSHDLRNPLNTLDLSLQLARQTGESEHFERCQRAVDRMEQLLEDLLALARQGQEIDSCEPVVLADAVEEAWETVETRDCELYVDVDRTLDADRTRLRQLLENLIHNATTHGGDTVRVTVGPLADGFYVTDDGTGIPESERDSVFETGYSTADEGTGFGLAIVQEIVDAHGWDITVTESDGGGARFEITGIPS